MYRFLIFAPLLTLLRDHNAVTPVRLEPAALRFRVKHSTTEPLRSLPVIPVTYLYMVADNHISIYTGRRKNRFCCRLLENVTFHPFPSQINSLTSSVEWNACFSAWNTPQLSRLTLPSSIALHSKAQFLNTPHFTGPLLPSSDAHPLSMSMIRNINIYSRLSLTQLCITQYYHLSRPDGPVPVFSPIYYCNSTTFISTTAKSIKLITRYEKLVPLINFSVFYNA